MIEASLGTPWDVRLEIDFLIKSDCILRVKQETIKNIRQEIRFSGRAAGDVDSKLQFHLVNRPRQMSRLTGRSEDDRESEPCQGLENPFRCTTMLSRGMAFS